MIRSNVSSKDISKQRHKQRHNHLDTSSLSSMVAVLVWGIHAVNIPLVSDIPTRLSHSLSKVAMDSLSTIGAFTKSSS